MTHLPALAVLCALLAAGPAFGQAPKGEAPPREARPDALPQEMDLKPAMSAASAWLDIVDAGRYAESWDASAALFREQVPKLQWERQLQDARGALGTLGSRKLASATYTPAPPNAPPGEYVIIQYHSRYENRPLTTEIVTPMREKDGSWRVSGYFIR
jgi:hypothetical protein